MILRFDRENDWQFEHLTNRKSYANTKRKARNARRFGEWIINLLETTAPRDRQDDELFACQGVSLHPANNGYLRDHVDPWTYLDYSPTDNDNLKLDEVEIVKWFEKKRLGQ